MTLRFPENTLAHYTARPLMQHLPAGSLPLSVVSQRSKEFLANHSADASPEREAVAFYCMNHLMAEIMQNFHKHEPLPSDVLSVVREYDDLISKMALRAFHYLIIICLRESRHASISAAKKTTLVELFDAQCAFFQETAGGEGGVKEKYLKSPPDTTVVKFCKSLAWIFYNTQFSPGYGGPAWGQVADCLVRYVTGEYTAEMMLDTIWTLSHNNGPIFNKGMLYAGFNSATILRILDVQRAGQIPTAVKHDPTISSYVYPWVMKNLDVALKRFPQLVLQGGVDWGKVKELGALGSYSGEKKKTPPKPITPPADMFQIMPGLSVKKKKRAELAA